MFYISNKYDYYLFGITDTDNNIEERYTTSMILKCINLGIQIEGVDDDRIRKFMLSYDYSLY